MKSVRLLALFLAAPVAAQIQFREVVTIDLAPTSNPASASYLGTHPSTIAWQPPNLFVAGWNEGGATGVGIVRVANAGTSPVFGAAFGSVAGTPTGFGFTGLDVGNGALLAAYDAGASHPQGLQCFSLITPGYLFFALNARGSSGAQIDWQPSTSWILGAAWLTIGSDRRALQNLASGATIYTHSDGMVVNPGGSNAWRDITHSWPEHHMFARRGNDVVRVIRTGVNSGTPSVIVDLVDADSVPGQSVELIQLGLHNFVIYNDRTSTAAGQSFFNVVRVASDSGVPQTVDWGTFSPPTGTGRYDFSFAGAGQRTFVILDCANRRATIFDVDLVPNVTPVCFGDGSGTVCPCGNNGAAGHGCASSLNPAGALLSASGTSSLSADTLVLHGSGMPDAAAALYFLGSNVAGAGGGVVFGDGLRCTSENIRRLRVVTNVAGASYLPGPGDPSLSVMEPAGATTYVYQVWYRNSAAFCTSEGFNLTNALIVAWGP